MRGVKRIGPQVKMSRQCIIPFEVLVWVGAVAYMIAMLTPLSLVHDVLHVSMLQKYVSDLTQVLSYEGLKLDQNISYEEKLIQVLDEKYKVLQNKTILLVKVLWRNNKYDEDAWELESDMKEKHPELFA